VPFEVAGAVAYVLHFASPASPIDYLELPIQTLKVGSLGTHNALGLAKQKGARFLLASTSEVYGDPLIHPQREDYWGNVNPIGPRGVYDEAKRFAEAMTMAYRRYHGVDTRIVRIFNSYGERMRLNDGRAIPAFMTQALTGKPLTVYGSGHQTRSFQYISDLVEGIWRLMGSSVSDPINIGNPHEMTLLALAEKYGKPAVVEAVRRGEGLDDNGDGTGGVEDLDDYSACRITRKEDFHDLYVKRFYFGCEADDPINAWAFNRKANPMHARLNAFFSSDIGHFDVPDMTDVVPEAYELVEHGLLTEDDFRDFMFTNAVRFWGEVNPDFFKGTVVETQAAEVLARPRT